MNRFLVRTGMVAAAVATAMVATARPAAAQIDPGFLVIRQNGEIVGEIFVPARTNATDYVEHWVLFPEYVYPGAMAGSVTEIVSEGRKTFSSVEEFFRSVAFPSGSRYVQVTAHDTDRLPR